MEEVAFKGMSLSRCVGCGGLWFAPEVLTSLRADAWMADYVLDVGQRRIGKQYNRVRDIDCPQCGKKMEQKSDPDQRHITYETCSGGHGTFLDAGELTDLLHNTFWDLFKLAR
jgi:Zn-finger nucleic acid-binding protein